MNLHPVLNPTHVYVFEMTEGDPICGGRFPEKLDCLDLRRLQGVQLAKNCFASQTVVTTFWAKVRVETLVEMRED